MTSDLQDVAGRDRLAIGWPARPPTGTVVVPGSKSLTNRALVLAALAEGSSVLHGALDAEDTRLMVAALRRCGVAIERHDDGRTLRVTGVGGPLTAVEDPQQPLEVGTAGTVARFLAAVLGASGGVTATLDGTERMRERPMAQLLDSLRTQGAAIDSHDGHLPVTITGAVPSGGEVVLDRPASSQIVSAMVLAGMLAAAPTRIVLPSGTPARPYVDMTLAVVRAFGGTAAWTGRDVIEVAPSVLQARDHEVEPDASAATYPLALAALHEGDVTVPGLGTDSLQGDVAFLDVLERLGATVAVSDGGLRVRGQGGLRGVDVDLTAMPDPGLTLAALAVHAEGPTRIRGVAVHRHHETDRIAAAATELRRLGAEVAEHADGLTITPPATPTRDVLIRTYLDHRMAMAFALVGHVVIDDPGCVNKTWPAYFAMLERFGMVDQVT